MKNSLIIHSFLNRKVKLHTITKTCWKFKKIET